MPTERMPKINELLRANIAQAIREELEVPLGSVVSVISVKTSSDLHYAKAYVSIVPDDKSQEILNLLNRHTKTIQSFLADKIVLRNTPKLQFMIDDIEQKAAEIDRLLDNLQ
ncbi:MAG: 30S ribosome-binding factor RbfA [Patescibacteria group bacterium]|jgi:ribosome-binding factor A